MSLSLQFKLIDGIIKIKVFSITSFILYLCVEILLREINISMSNNCRFIFHAKYAEVITPGKDYTNYPGLVLDYFC